MTGTLRGVSNKHCLLSFFFISSGIEVMKLFMFNSTEYAQLN